MFFSCRNGLKAVILLPFCVYFHFRSYGDIKISQSSIKPVEQKTCNDNCTFQGSPSLFQQSASNQVQDEAQGEALESDAVAILNEQVAHQSATEDGMEVDPPIDVPVSGPIDELAMDPPIEELILDPPAGELVSNETQEQHNLTEAISKESQNLNSENGVAEPQTLTETQERDMVTKTVSKDTPNLTHGSQDTESTPVENQDPSTSTKCFQSVFVSKKEDSCIYICCRKCFRGVHAAVHKVVSEFWISHANCSRIEDMHDILTSYGLNLVSALSRWHATQSINQHDAVHLHSCSCFKMALENAELAPQECECHMPNGEGAEDITLSFLFRDGVLMPMRLWSDVDSRDAPHCSFKRLCVCPVLDSVSSLCSDLS
jgi:hypothetical protein